METGPLIFCAIAGSIVIITLVPLIKRHLLNKNPLNRELKWGGWFKIMKNVYATDREEFFVAYWNKYECEWYNDANKFPTKAEAEARADTLYDEVLVEEGVHVAP